MMRPPMPCDIHAPRKPNPGMLLRVIKKSPQPGKASGTPGKPAMQPNRHHFGGLRTLGIKRVKAVDQIVGELARAVEALRRGEAVWLLQKGRSSE